MDDLREDIVEDVDDRVAGSATTPRPARFRDRFWQDVDRVRGLLRGPEPCDPSELAGFFDGDGCFYHAQYAIGCNLTQCHYPTLQRIQECYGGTIDKRDTKDRSPNQRFQYGLTFSNIASAAIVPIVKDHLVIKGARARRLLEVLDLYNKTDEASATKRRELAADKTDEYAFDRINKSYIRGLFCAEGCLMTSQISIAQKGCLDLLRAMQAYIGTQLGVGPEFGNVNETAWAVYKRADIKRFLDWLTDGNTRRLFHEEKAAQVDAFYAHWETRNAAYANEITRLKHVDFDVPDATIVAANAASHEFTAALRSVYLNRTVAPAAPKAEALDDEQRRVATDLLRTTDESLETIATRVGGTKEQVQYLKKTDGIERPNPPAKTVQLTPAQQREVRKMLLEEGDVSYAAIGKRAGCSKGQVFRFAAEIGAPARTPGRKHKATGIEVVTEPREKEEEQGDEEETKKDVKKTRYMAPRLTEDAKATMKGLLAKKTMTLAQIATAVGCTKPQVATYKKKWGL
jgi:hypothetical protein